MSESFLSQSICSCRKSEDFWQRIPNIQQSREFCGCRMQQSTMLKFDVLRNQHFQKLSTRKFEWYEDVSKLNRFADAELAKFRECDKSQIKLKKPKVLRILNVRQLNNSKHLRKFSNMRENSEVKRIYS